MDPLSTPALDPDHPPPFSAVILAGGRSRRMGTDKALLTVDGVPLLVRQIETARAAGAREILLSQSADHPRLIPGTIPVPDPCPDAGPLAGIGAAAAIARSPQLAVLAVDLPMVTPHFLRTLHTQTRPNLGVVPRLNARYEPLLAFYPVSIAVLARHQLDAGRRSLQDLVARGIEAGLLAAVDVGPEWEGEFTNWNVPADLPGLIPGLKPADSSQGP